MSTTPSNLDPELIDVLDDDPALLALARSIITASPRFASSKVDTWLSPRRRSSARSRLSLQQHLVSRRRSRARSARLSIASGVALVLVLIVAPLALAFRSQIVDLITGEPAPESVVDSLSAWNRMLKQSVPAPNGAFGPGMQAVADRAAGVVSLQTPDGPVDLWAAPEVGGGKCFVLAINDAPSQSRSDYRAIGTCDSQLPRYLYSNPDVIIPRPVSFDSMPDVSFVVVRVFNAPRVEIRFSDGSTLPLRIVDGFSLVAVPPNSIPPGNQQPITIVARDEDGAIIATDPLLNSSSVG